MTLLAQLPPETGKIIERATESGWQSGTMCLLIVVALGFMAVLVATFGFLLKWILHNTANRDELANKRDEQRSQEAQNRESGYTLRLVGVEEFCRTKLLATTEECAQALVKSSEANHIMSDALAASNAATRELSRLVESLSGKHAELLGAVVKLIEKVTDGDLRPVKQPEEPKG